MRRPPRVLCLFVLWVGMPRAPAAETTPPVDEPAKNAAAIAAGKARQAEIAAALLEETNRIRRENNRKPLRRRLELDLAADDQAAFMALTFSAKHTSPIIGRETASARVKQRGLEVALVAENVASLPVAEGEDMPSARDIAAQFVAQWFASPGHRANLLHPEVTHLGGAVRIVRMREQWCAFGVQVFSTAPLRGSRGEVPP